jgi:hypothetical protein
VQRPVAARDDQPRAATFVQRLIELVSVLEQDDLDRSLDLEDLDHGVDPAHHRRSRRPRW